MNRAIEMIGNDSLAIDEAKAHETNDDDCKKCFERWRQPYRFAAVVVVVGGGGSGAGAGCPHEGWLTRAR